MHTDVQVPRSTWMCESGPLIREKTLVQPQPELPEFTDQLSGDAVELVYTRDLLFVEPCLCARSTRVVPTIHFAGVMQSGRHP